MAVICPNCGSADTQTLVDKNQCLNCGSLITQDGNVAATGADQNTKDMIAKSLQPREVNLVGNMADLQRAGAVGHFDATNDTADVGSQTEANEAANAKLADQTASSASESPSTPSGDQMTTTTNSGNKANG